MIAADGRVVWLQDRVTVHVVDGRPVTLRGVMVDITERKRAEAALRESEERFRTLADSAPMLVWTSGAGSAAATSSTGAGSTSPAASSTNVAARDGWYRGPASRRPAGGAGAARGRLRGAGALRDGLSPAARRRRVPLDVDARRARASTRSAASPATSGPASTSPSGGGPRRRGSGSRRSCGSRRRWRRWARSPAASPTTSTTCWPRSAATSRSSRWTSGSRASGPGEPGRDAARRASRHRAGQAHPHLQPSRDARAGADPARARGRRGRPPAPLADSRGRRPVAPRRAGPAGRPGQRLAGAPGDRQPGDQRLAGDGRRARPDRHPARRPRPSIRRWPTATATCGRAPTSASRSRTPGTAWRRRRSSGSSSRSSPPRRRARAPASACRWCTASPAGTAGPSSSRASCERARPSGCCSRRASEARRASPNRRPCPHELRGDGERILYLDDEEPLVKLAVVVPRAARLSGQRLHARRRGAGGVPRPAGRLRSRRDRLQHADHVGDGRRLDRDEPAAVRAGGAGLGLPASGRGRARARRSASAPPSASPTRSRSSARSCSACCTPGTSRRRGAAAPGLPQRCSPRSPLNNSPGPTAPPRWEWPAR